MLTSTSTSAIYHGCPSTVAVTLSTCERLASSSLEPPLRSLPILISTSFESSAATSSAGNSWVPLGVLERALSIYPVQGSATRNFVVWSRRRRQRSHTSWPFSLRWLRNNVRIYRRTKMLLTTKPVVVKSPGTKKPQRLSPMHTTSDLLESMKHQTLRSHSRYVSLQPQNTLV